MANYVTLHDGTEVDLENPDLTGVDMATLAIQLYRQMRYNGATKRPYCVLEHSIRGARALQLYGSAYGRTAALHFLLHDAHEAIMGDIAAPVARMVSGISRMKERLDDAVYRLVGINRPTGPVLELVIATDQVMFQREWIDLMPTRFDRAAAGGCHDGPTRDFMVEHGIFPDTIDPYLRPSFQMLFGEFMHLLRVLK